MSVDTNVQQRVNKIFTTKTNSKEFDEGVDNYIKQGMNEAVVWHLCKEEVPQTVASNIKTSDSNDLKQLRLIRDVFMILIK